MRKFVSFSYVRRRGLAKADGTPHYIGLCLPPLSGPARQRGHADGWRHDGDGRSCAAAAWQQRSATASATTGSRQAAASATASTASTKSSTCTTAPITEGCRGGCVSFGAGGDGSRTCSTYFATGYFTTGSCSESDHASIHTGTSDRGSFFRDDDELCTARRHEASRVPKPA